MLTVSRKRVSQIVGISERRVHFYTDQGLLSNMILCTGRGNAREYSITNIKELFFIKRLRAAGIELSSIKDILRAPGSFPTKRREIYQACEILGRYCRKFHKAVALEDRSITNDR